jgi:alpha-ketoglutarate-dependent taurine dioxygenase
MTDMNANPFHPEETEAYLAWREAKLADYPARIEDLLVEVRDPRRPSAAEVSALRARCRKANMAIYVTPCGNDPDKAIPRRMGEALGLRTLDCHLMTDGDGLSALTVAADGDARGKGEFIPYTNKAIRWHTDGYYNDAAHQIHGLQLYCVESAAEGGENQLFDHELAYIALRDQNPDIIRALMQPDAMTIPARLDDSGVARPDQAGPVFSVHAGALHMRYTARTRSIAWKEDPAVKAAVAALEALLATPPAHVFRARLEAGMGLVCNNVLHDRAAFTDGPARKRLIYRARYYERVTAEG